MWGMQLDPCLHLGKELVPLEEQEDGLCFILKTTGLRGCLPLMTTICCPGLLSWAHGSLASGLGGGLEVAV